MIESPPEILRDAIARNAAAVISLPAAGMLRHRKTRLLAEMEGGIWMGLTPPDRGLVDELVMSSRLVGVAFMHRTVKVVFATPIIARRAEFSVNANIQVEAACLRFPDVIKAVQRRANYRVSIPSPSDLQSRVWRLAEHALLRDRPTPSLEIKGSIRDLSTGGMAFLLRPEPGGTAIANEQRLRILLRFGESEALMEGRVRYALALPNDALRLGIQFHHLQDELEGRQATSKLNTIVGQLQRTEVRRLRMGLQVQTTS